MSDGRLFGRQNLLRLDQTQSDGLLDGKLELRDDDQNEREWYRGFSYELLVG